VLLPGLENDYVPAGIEGAEFNDSTIAEQDK
jgi:hypothetical protein